MKKSIFLAGVLLMGLSACKNTEKELETADVSEEVVMEEEVIEITEQESEEAIQEVTEKVDLSGIPGRYPEGSGMKLGIEVLGIMDLPDLQLMRDEIYARHGFIFAQDPGLDKYFRNQSWYNPKTKNVDSKLSEIERHNIEEIEGMMGLKEEGELESMMYGGHPEKFIAYFDEEYHKISINEWEAYKKSIGTKQDEAIEKIKKLSPAESEKRAKELEKTIRKNIAAHGVTMEEVALIQQLDMLNRGDTFIP